MNKEIWTFIWQYEMINTSQQYQGDCADIVFINNGDSAVTINGAVLQVGDSMADPAFGNEYSNNFRKGSLISKITLTPNSISNKIFNVNTQIETDTSENYIYKIIADYTAFQIIFIY